MYRKFILFIISSSLLCLPFYSQAQSKKDSLTALINKENNAGKKHTLYLERSVLYSRKDTASAFKDIKKASAYFTKSNDLKKLGKVYVNTGKIYFKARKYEETCKADSIAIKLARQTGDKKGEAFATGELGWAQYVMRNIPEAEKNVSKSIALEEQLKKQDIRRIVALSGLMGAIKNALGKQTESLKYFEKAIALGDKLSNKKELIRVYANYANTLDDLSQSEKAVENHLQAMRLAEQYKDSAWIMREYNNIAITYKNLKEYDKAISFYKHSLKMAVRIQNYDQMGFSMMNMANINTTLGNYEKADSFYQRSIQYFKKAKNAYGNCLIYHNYGRLLIEQHKYEEGRENILKSLAYRKKAGAPALIAQSLSVLGELMTTMNELDKAESYLNRADSIYSKVSGNKNFYRDLYFYKKQLYIKKGDYKKAYAAQQKEMEYRQELFDESEKINALKRQTEYDLEKRDSQIETERALHRHKQIFMLSIGGGILLILMLFLFILLQRRKQAKERYQAELLQLEQQHRLNLADSLAKAEQEERKKVASKLHDETGGILSVIKLNIDQLDENVFVAGSDAGDKLKATKKLLSEAAESIRNISHTLMPVALEKYGLKAALQDLVNAINTSGKIKIEDVLEGLEDSRSWNPQLSLTIYRMVQEAFSNIIRHAQATNVLFQVIELENSVTIYIEDNGRGLKTDSSDADGIGLNLLKQNIEYLNGKIEINSKENQGTFVLAELPIRRETGL